jgi:hypothetical protein
MRISFVVSCLICISLPAAASPPELCGPMPTAPQSIACSLARQIRYDQERKVFDSDIGQIGDEMLIRSGKISWYAGSNPYERAYISFAELAQRLASTQERVIPAPVMQGLWLATLHATYFHEVVDSISDAVVRAEPAR